MLAAEGLVIITIVMGLTLTVGFRVILLFTVDRPKAIKSERFGYEIG